ncbi:MAG TPA: threonine--tRNA ligase [Acidobacteriota bacterium]
MSELTFVTADGEQHCLPSGLTFRELAVRLYPEQAGRAIAVKLEGEIRDFHTGASGGGRITLITLENPNDRDALEVMRHSASHVLAQAVTHLFPGVKVGIGPAIDNGFYYDFQREESFKPEDLERIESEMRSLIASDQTFSRREVTKEEALDFFGQRSEKLKCELIEERADQSLTLYQQGDFIDFCRGPHLPSTGAIGPIKVLKVAGAYWKGDEHRPMLQRIYATAFFRQQDLDAFLQLQEEAARRDHRTLGKQLDLFSIQEQVGGGLIFWHPKGASIRQRIEEFLRQQLLAHGYDFVYTPHIARSSLWQTSGHAQYYRDNMFFLEVENEEFVLKPMNCPGHIQIYKSRRRSYRDLPVRLAEFGTVYRNERGGTLHGLLRVKGFTQDDAHIFCTPEQIGAEVRACLELAEVVLKTFGFERFQIDLSVRDPAAKAKYAGSDEEWDRAEQALVESLEEKGLPYQRKEGEAVFYGPKIDIKLFDALGREWQLTTVQFDFTLPQRFGVTYVGSDSKEHTAVMVHRALLGSMERFFGTLIEHYAGAFPFWLAPVQVVVLPVAERHGAAAEALRARLHAAGLRAEVDGRPEKIGYKIREAQLQKVPFMVVMGDREIESGRISVRNRFKGDLGATAVEDFIAECAELDRSRATKP